MVDHVRIKIKWHTWCIVHIRTPNRCY